MLVGGPSGLLSLPTNTVKYSEFRTVLLRTVVVGNNHQQGKRKKDQNVVDLVENRMRTLERR